MGALKRIERSGKRALMRSIAAFVRAPRRSTDEVAAMEFERILVIRQHNQMGDMLLATPALRAIKQRYPGAALHVVSSTLNRGVMHICPYVDRVFTYDKRNPLSHAGLVAALRRQRYDLAIVLHTVSFSFTSVALAVLSRARMRVGSTSARVGDDLAGSYLNLTLPLPDAAALADMNEAEHNLVPLRAIGIDTDDLAPEIRPLEASERWADDFARGAWPAGAVRLAVHPGAGKRENIWPPERFAAVVNRLAEERNIAVVVVEGPRDRDTVAAFSGACRAPATVLAGRGIGDVAAVLTRADLVLCNDTGVMHVAVAAGADTLAVFGPTDPVRWAPRRDCLTVVRSPTGRLDEVDPGRVALRAGELLESVAARQHDVER